jgi:hypothetical protein
MWNYRIVDVSDGVEEPIYEIREVFYNSKGLPYGHGEAAVVGENLEEMKDVLYMMAEAFNKNPLNGATDFSNDFNG